MVKFEVAKADLSFEATFKQPEFNLFRDTFGLARSLYARLQPHGLRLQDMKLERGSGSIADFHVLCYLFNFVVNIKVRVDRIEAYCTDVPRDFGQRFGTAIVDGVLAVPGHLASVSFRTYAVAVGLHGILEGERVSAYLSRFGANVPTELGPSTAKGSVLYFGPAEDRLLSSLTVDLSGLIPDCLYVRPQAIWDADKVELQTLPARVESFVRRAVSSLGLALPT